MKDKYVVKKLDEDDILEIITEHFLGKECSDYLNAKACVLGVPGEDLRVLAVFSKDDEKIQCDFEELDKCTDFNGDHTFLLNNPEFYIDDTKNG